MATIGFWISGADQPMHQYPVMQKLNLSGACFWHTFFSSALYKKTIKERVINDSNVETVLVVGDYSANTALFLTALSEEGIDPVICLHNQGSNTDIEEIHFLIDTNGWKTLSPEELCSYCIEERYK